jgi:predicted Zn-dependent protease
MARHSVLLFALIFCGIVPARPQQNCPLPPSLQSISPADNMFSDQQEVDLGDAMAEAVALRVNIIQNDELTAHLRELGNRLIQHLPSTKLNFRFFLIDLPQINAFSIAGGRVYVSRKIVAFARNDDELAGVLAHELGHVVTHQSAIEMTRAFREILSVTQVAGRDDVFRKFHQYAENVSRQRHRSRGEEEKHQIVADQVSVYALARAGFNVQAFPEFWDRFAELHGKTGTWVSDLVGSTTPAQHRLRDMIKNVGALPPGCADQAMSANETEFKAWQAAVVDFDNGTRSEILPGLISKHRLSARLRPEITNLRFSPNGKYILAQDDGALRV